MFRRMVLKMIYSLFIGRQTGGRRVGEEKATDTIDRYEGPRQVYGIFRSG